ncbi:MAG TPA: hypothetical protein VIV40_00120 [Kofleriaceae bacterium]
MNLHRTIPLILALLVPAASAHAIDVDPEPDLPDDSPASTVWQKTYSKAKLYGSTDWGAGYRINGGVSATPAHGTYKDQLGARITAETYAKVNGSTWKVFAARATGATEAQRRTDLSVTAYVGSQAVWTDHWSSTTSTKTLYSATPAAWTIPFFDQHVTVDVYGIDVTFRLKAQGELRTSLSGKLSNVGLEASGTASGRADLYASAAVGHTVCMGSACVGAEAGVYTDVDLVKVSVPARVAAWWSFAPTAGVQINYVAKADATITSLSGELGVWANACIIGCIGGTKELISWAGATATFVIANHSGTYCLAGECSMLPPSSENT